MLPQSSWRTWNIWGQLSVSEKVAMYGLTTQAQSYVYSSNWKKTGTAGTQYSIDGDVLKEFAEFAKNIQPGWIADEHAQIFTLRHAEVQTNFQISFQKDGCDIKICWWRSGDTRSSPSMNSLHRIDGPAIEIVSPVKSHRHQTWHIGGKHVYPFGHVNQNNWQQYMLQEQDYWALVLEELHRAGRIILPEHILQNFLIGK